MPIGEETGSIYESRTLYEIIRKAVMVGGGGGLL